MNDPVRDNNEKETTDITIENGLAVASWLPPGEKFSYWINEEQGLYGGFSRGFLGEDIFAIMKEDKTTKHYVPIVEARRFGADTTIHRNLDETVDIDAAFNSVLEKLYAQMRENKTPNTLLMSKTFSTSDKDVVWRSMASPFFPLLEEETTENPWRRLYMNVNLPAEKYHTTIKEMVRIVRKYYKPLFFKALYAGKKLDNTVRDPKETKMVFYFPPTKRGKQDAIEFAKWFESNGMLNSIQAGELLDRESLKKDTLIFAGGKLILSKGTKEKRQEVINMGDSKLQKQYSIRK
jgi:hypothetical protein